MAVQNVHGESDMAAAPDPLFRHRGWRIPDHSAGKHAPPSPQHAPPIGMGSAWSGMPKVMLCYVINKHAGIARFVGLPKLSHMSAMMHVSSEDHLDDYAL